MPVCAVKSLLSSTNAFAGSQAAQPRVILSDFTTCADEKANTKEEIKIAILFFIFPPIKYCEIQL